MTNVYILTVTFKSYQTISKALLPICILCKHRRTLKNPIDLRCTKNLQNKFFSVVLFNLRSGLCLTITLKTNMPEKLEEEIKKKIKPIVDEAMHRFVGVKIDELSTDISDKLKKSPLLDFEIDSSLPFKKAKKRFIRFYVIKLLRLNYGNISLAAKAAGMDRRSIHRLVNELNINIDEYKKEILRPEYVKEENIKDAIADVLDHYKEILHPKKMELAYKSVPSLSKDLLKELPAAPPALKEAEEEFERNYFKKILEENKGNLTEISKKIRIRYETLLRKIKKLGL